VRLNASRNCLARRARARVDNFWISPVSVFIGRFSPARAAASGGGKPRTRVVRVLREYACDHRSRSEGLAGGGAGNLRTVA
jgi:hypothetical protein